MSTRNGHPVYERTELEVLKRAVDLPTLIQEHGVPLRKVGKSLLGRCPFHADEEESLSINLESDPPLWKCFGCQQGGDAFTFLRMKEGWSFEQAVTYLQAQAAGTLDEAQLAELRERAEQPAVLAEVDPDRLAGGQTRYALLQRVAGFYAHRLAESREARTYLLERGLGVAELLDSFAVGYCDGHSLLKTIPEDGELRTALIQLGVINEKGREHFAGCVVVPLTTEQGVVGLYGRKIAPHARVKHLYLRGQQRGVLNWQALKSSREIFVAESVFDALSLWAAGERSVTCVYGANGLHRDLSEMLTRYAVTEIRFCLDADRAGLAATARLSGQLSVRGIRCFHVALPKGKDPNQILVEQGASALAEMLGQITLAPTPEDGELLPPVVEIVSDGIILRFGELSYRVTPQPPFGSRLKVAVRPTWRNKSFVDRLDLYSHRARQMSTNHICRHLDLPRAQVERHLLSIMEETDRWVLSNAQSAEDEAQDKKPVVLTDKERDEALAFLRRPDLADAVLRDMEALGAVGEELPKLLVYLIGLSRKLERPLAGVIISQSGAGKSSLADMVESLTPPEEVVSFSRISTQALMFEEKDYLKRKLLIIEERAGAEQADYSIRVLVSKQKLSQASVTKDPNTGRMYTKHYEVHGPIAYLETTTNPRINHENATRCFEICLDESEEQTQRIHQRQREARTPHGLMKRTAWDDIRQRHHNAQRLLQMVRVVIPYVTRLSFPSRWLRTRRDHERFLCLIEAVAFLHQYSRPRKQMERDGQAVEYIEATVDDYRLAYDLARQVLGITLHELTRGAQDLLELTRQMVAEAPKRHELVHFTRRDLRQYTGWQDHRLRDALDELVDMEYVLVLKGAQGQTFQYRLGDGGGGEALPLRELTTPEQLEAMLKRDKKP